MTESIRPYVNDPETSHNVLNEEDQEALELYLKGGLRNPDDNYSGPERRQRPRYADKERRSLTRVVNSAIEVNIGMKYKSTDGSDRAIALTEFEDWEPMSAAEANTVVEGAVRRMNNAAHTNIGDGEKAAAERYNLYTGFISDAYDDMQILNQAISAKEGEEPGPDPALIRTDAKVLGVIAKHLMERGFLWNNHWPAKNTGSYQQRDKYWRGFTILASRAASDNQIEKLYSFVKQRNQLRLHYWLREAVQVEKSPIFKQLQEQEKVFPLNFNRLLQPKIEQEDTASETDRPAEGINFDSMLSPRARAEVDASRAKWEAGVDRLDSTRPSMRIIEKELGRQGIKRAPTADEVEDEEQRTLAELREKAKAKTQPKQTKKQGRRRRVFYGRSATNSEADKRVEFENEDR